MAKKEEEFIETAERIETEYKRALKYQKVEAALAEYIGREQIELKIYIKTSFFKS